MNHLRVVVTGIGALSPAGVGLAPLRAAWLAGCTCAGETSALQGTPFEGLAARGIPGFRANALLAAKGLRYLNRATLLACAAARLALDDAGLVLDDALRPQVGVALGTAFGNFRNDCEFDRSVLLAGHRCLNPLAFPNTVVSTPASHVSLMFGVRGFNSTVSSGEAASADALALAWRYLCQGRVPLALAGGVDDLCAEGYARLLRLGAVDAAPPPGLSAPFDRRRDGCVPAEAAAFLLLEEREHALRRGARVYAELRGVGAAFDPARLEAYLECGDGYRSGPGAARQAMAEALAAAGLDAAVVDYVAAGANSSVGADRAEAQALRSLFGARTAVSSIKGALGETLGASGALQAVAAALALREGWVPPTAGYAEFDPECDVPGLVTGAAREQALRHALIHASDASGIDSALVLSAA